VPGHTAVITIVQSVASWFIQYAFVERRLDNGSVQPIGFVKRPSSPSMDWFFRLPSNNSTRIEKFAVKSWGSFSQHLMSALLLSLSSFFILFPPSVVVLLLMTDALSGDMDFMQENRVAWKLLLWETGLGFFFGLVMGTITATLWLIRAGWEAHCVEE
jgi:hypothetical protein